MNVQPTNDQADNIFERYTKPGSPGCAVAVMKEGKVVHEQGYGLANLEHSVPVLPSFVVFERDGRGTIAGLRVSGTRVRNLRFARQYARTMVAKTMAEVLRLFAVWQIQKRIRGQESRVLLPRTLEQYWLALVIRKRARQVARAG